MSRLLLVAVVLVCLSCGPRNPTTGREQPIYDVGWKTLTRDYPMASSYIGERVRIHIDSGEYAVVGADIHVWMSQRVVPPVIAFKNATADGKSSIIVVGRVKSVNRDGKWRGPRCDFQVDIEDCVVMVHH